MKRHMTRNELGKVYRLSDEQLDVIKAEGYQTIGYNAGVYGWNYDIYLIGGEYCVHGYRPLLKWERLGDEKFNKLTGLKRQKEDLR